MIRRTFFARLLAALGLAAFVPSLEAKKPATLSQFDPNDIVAYVSPLDEVNSVFHHHFGKTWFVDMKNGKDTNDGLSVATAFKNEHRAYDEMAAKGDVVYLMGSP